MSVAGDGCDTFDTEVEEGGGETGFLEEGDEERAETGVDVEGDAAAECNFGESSDIVDYTVREIRGRADDLVSVSGRQLVNGDSWLTRIVL